MTLIQLNKIKERHCPIFQGNTAIVMNDSQRKSNRSLFFFANLPRSLDTVQKKENEQMKEVFYLEMNIYNCKVLIDVHRFNDKYLF